MNVEFFLNIEYYNKHVVQINLFLYLDVTCSLR